MEDPEYTTILTATTSEPAEARHRRRNTEAGTIGHHTWRRRLHREAIALRQHQPATETGLDQGALSLFLLLAVAGTRALGPAGDDGVVFHLLDEAVLRMGDGLWVPLYGFPVASVVTGFCLLARRPWTRIAHTVLGVYEHLHRDDDGHEDEIIVQTVAAVAGVKETLSPAMDILVSSNFERLLWYLAYDNAKGADDEERRRRAGGTIAEWMGKVKSDGRVQVPTEVLERARADFFAERVSDEQTLETIKYYFDSAKYIADPHTAVGLQVARIVAPSK